ncbi:MAG: hypothetical protein V4633_18050 [Pseudomonadota bacterium]
MANNKPFPDPANAHALQDEADIGSGEAAPGQQETEAMIRDIPPLPEHEDALDDETDAPRARREHDDSLLRDEPSDELDQLDPVPPKGGV